MSWDKEAWKERCRVNARSLESEINRLRSDYRDPVDLGSRQYDEFWAHAKQISAMFKTLKPLFREDRERLWVAFLATWEEMKVVQAREREARLNNS
jgi:hypothetical protein